MGRAYFFFINTKNLLFSNYKKTQRKQQTYNTNTNTDTQQKHTAIAPRIEHTALATRIKSPMDLSVLVHRTLSLKFFIDTKNLFFSNYKKTQRKQQTYNTNNNTDT